MVCSLCHPLAWLATQVPKPLSSQYSPPSLGQTPTVVLFPGPDGELRTVVYA